MRTELSFIFGLVGLVLLCAVIWPAEVGTKAGQITAAFNAAAFPQQ